MISDVTSFCKSPIANFQEMFVKNVRLFDSNISRTCSQHLLGRKKLPAASADLILEVLVRLLVPVRPLNDVPVVPWVIADGTIALYSTRPPMASKEANEY